MNNKSYVVYYEDTCDSGEGYDVPCGKVDFVASFSSESAAKLFLDKLNIISSFQEEYTKNYENETHRLMLVLIDARNSFDKSFEETKEYKEFYESLDKDHPPFSKNRRSLRQKAIANFEQQYFGKTIDEARNEAVKQQYDAYNAACKEWKIPFDLLSQKLIYNNPVSYDPKDFEVAYAVANSNNGYELSEVQNLEHG